MVIIFFVSSVIVKFVKFVLRERNCINEVLSSEKDPEIQTKNNSMLLYKSSFYNLLITVNWGVDCGLDRFCKQYETMLFGGSFHMKSHFIIVVRSQTHARYFIYICDMTGSK